MRLALRRSIVRLQLAAAALATLCAASRPAEAVQRTLKYVTTGNGFGFQVYDVDQKKIVEFLEHPYRYLSGTPGNPKGEGIGRRNLAYDIYFGIRGNGGAGWLSQGANGLPEYLDQTNIIRVPINAFGADTESYFFAPFGYQGNAMIALLHAPTATDGYAMLNFHLGAGQPNPGSEGESIQPVSGNANAVYETGPGGGAMVYVGLSGLDGADCANAYAKVQGGQDLANNPSCSGTDQVLGLQRKLADGWWAVGVQYVENPSDAATAAQALQTWAASRAPSKILDDAKAEFEAWRKPIPAEIEFKNDDELKTWRQSETVLRMGQIIEPYTDQRRNHGMMLASLPHGEWHTGWVRDGLYGTVALARTGHAEEARYAMDFLLNADPVGKYTADLNAQIKPGDPVIDDYRVSAVRYFGDGEEEADYSGQPTPNVEVDGWGLALWGARQYVDGSGDVAWLQSTTKLENKTVYQVLVDGIATPLERYLEPTGIVKKDSGIWEVHQGNARHFAYTTLSAARGFCDMAAIARRMGNDADQKKYFELAKKVTQGFLAAFKDQNNALVGSLEGTTASRADAAVIEVFTWNIIKDYSSPYVQPTFDLLNTLQVQSGGYKRNDENQSSYDNHEWILIDLRMSNAFRRSGNTAHADQLLDGVVSKGAVNFHLLPELYSAVSSEATIGSYWGSIPMVGYGAGAYLMTVMDRANLIEPNDCGTLDPPPVDGGVGGGGGAGGGSTEGGAGAAGAGGTGCDELTGCAGGNSATTDGLIPRKEGCMCRFEPDRWESGTSLAFLGLPLGLALWRLASRRRQGRGKAA